MEDFIKIWYNFIGYSTCHQILERTISFHGKFLFVCCRCSGIYIGYFISYIFILLTGKWKSGKLPPKNTIILGSILSSLMFIDVGTVMAHLRPGNNDIRIITGMIAGSSLAFLVFPALNYFFPHDVQGEKRVLTGSLPYIFIILMGILIFFIIKSNMAFLFWPFFIIIGAGLILTYINLNSIFILLLFKFLSFFRINIFHTIILSGIMSFLEMLCVYLLYKKFGIK